MSAELLKKKKKLKKGIFGESRSVLVGHTVHLTFRVIILIDNKNNVMVGEK